MKKITLLFLAFSMAALISSCKKDDDNTSTPSTGGGSTAATKTEMLTAKNWKITAGTLGGQDIFSSSDECDKDDLHIFKTDGTYVNDEGATKCDPTDDQIIVTSTWKLIDNETKIEFDGETGTIKELTSTKMVLEADFNGTPAVTTFTAQ